MIRRPALSLGALAGFLLVAVSVRNRMIDKLAAETGFSAKAMDFMLGGGLECALAAAIIVLVWAHRKTLAGVLIVATSGLAIFEAAQRPVCRALISDMRKVQRDMDLCEHLLGLPISPWTGWMFFIIICVLVVVFNKKRGPQ